MDEIQRKLIEIDADLKKGNKFFPYIIEKAPLIVPTTGLITGLILQSIIKANIYFWGVALFVFAFAALLLYYRLDRKNKNVVTYVLACITMICFICLGQIRMLSYKKLSEANIKNLVGNKRTLATISGYIISKPIIHEKSNWAFGRFSYGDSTTGFYLNLNKIKSTNASQRCFGTIKVWVSEPVFDLKAGDYIRTDCWLETLPAASNPGQFDQAKYLEKKNIFICASVRSRQAIYLPRICKKDFFTTLNQKVKVIASTALLGDLDIESAGQGLLEAILLGYRGNVDSETQLAFQKTGLLHFISLSGLHIAILLGIVWWFCKTAGFGRTTRGLVCIFTAALFLLIVPARSATLRAIIISFFFSLSFVIRRKPNSFNTLALAALILLLIRPTQLFEPGWQLSFASVTGILLFTEKFQSFFWRIIPWLKSNNSNAFLIKIAKKVTSLVFALFSVGLAAWIGGVGIILYYFYTINPLSSIWTIAAFPLVGAILVTGYLKMLASFLLPTVAAFLGVILTTLSQLLAGLVKLLARVELSEILIGRVNLLWIVGYYGIVVMICSGLLKRLVSKTNIIIAAVVCFVLLPFWLSLRDNGDLVLSFLDVSHGQAVVVQFPNNKNILFDAGSMHKNNVGDKIVVPFLRYKGINKLNAVIISHNDTDHINGIPEIIKKIKVKTVYANQGFFNETKTDGTIALMKKCLDENKLSMTAIPDQIDFDDECKVKFIWPVSSTDKSQSDNNRSTVILIEFAGKKILLCADIEKYAQDEILKLYPDLCADVFLIPHHGSAKTLDKNFIEKIAPTIAICSCSISQYLNKQLYQPTGDETIFNTCKKGAVTIKITRDGSIVCDHFLKQP